MKAFLPLVAAAILLIAAGESRAQAPFAQTELNRLSASGNAASYSADRLRVNNVASALPRGLSTNVLSGAMGRPNKPFSSVSRGPSVTPYLALDQPFSNTATNYYTMVRPQLEQQRVNQQMQRQTEMMQRQLSQVTSQPPFDPSGSQTMAPTGHAAVYMNYGGYYQTPPPRRR
jgi:hypothetical protein